MRSISFATVDEETLFGEVLRRRASGEDFGSALGELCERWREPARIVVRRIQGSYLRGSPEDAEDVFQEAVTKLVTRGLDQFRGISEQMPGKAASPRTFFLRIIKHVAIDRYRRSREDLAPGRDDGEGEPRESAYQVTRAMEQARHHAERSDASETYWHAFERLRREHPNEAAAWDLYHHQDVEDHGECAKRLQISVTNSYKRVSRAQAWLKLYVVELREKEESP